MSPEHSPKAQVQHAWAFTIDRLGPATYAVYQGRDISLLTLEELRMFLHRYLGGNNGLGGGHVG